MTALPWHAVVSCSAWPHVRRSLRACHISYLAVRISPAPPGAGHCAGEASYAVFCDRPPAPARKRRAVWHHLAGRGLCRLLSAWTASRTPADVERHG